MILVRGSNERAFWVKSGDNEIIKCNIYVCSDWHNDGNYVCETELGGWEAFERLYGYQVSNDCLFKGFLWLNEALLSDFRPYDTIIFVVS